MGASGTHVGRPPIKHSGGVVALSGFTTGTDGRVKLFSFLLNRAEASLRTRRAADRLASTVTGCW